MRSSGIVENLSLQLFQALNGMEWNGMERNVLQCRLANSPLDFPNKKEQWSHQGPLLFFEQTFYLFSVVWSVWITEQLQQQ
jgi:hypothetical protein